MLKHDYQFCTSGPWKELRLGNISSLGMMGSLLANKLLLDWRGETDEC